METRFAAPCLALFALAAPLAAHADDAVCSLAPSATLSLEDRPALPDGSPDGFIAQGFSAKVDYHVGAMANPNVSCDNLSRQAGGRIEPAGVPDDQDAYGGDTEDVGSLEFTGLDAGTYRVRTTFGCRCGILGAVSQSLFSNSIVVPPTISLRPGVESDDRTNEVTLDTVPANAAALLIVTVGAKLCAGEKMTVTLTAPGVTKTLTGEGTEDCTGGSVSGTIDFTPTGPGALTVVAEYAGKKSNVVTGHVVAGSGGSTDNGSSDSSGGDSSSKGGCHAVEASSLALAVAAALRGRRRRS